MPPDVEEASVPCPGCGSAAEPEQDGQVTYYACTECGQEFGHQVRAPDGPLCAAGLPIQAAEERPAVFLGATIPVRRQE